jgi:A/G-specific adenine glycosylase
VTSDKALTRSLLDWYARARRDLPWRGVRDPYATWVSETMLQQTRVQTVLPYYDRFMRELPTVRALAEAPEERVLALWSGLGYSRRARMLQAAAKRVASAYGGRIPEDAEELRRLEGVGAYTAGAIASIAFGRRAALVDGNVARVLARLFAVEQDVKSVRGSALLWKIAKRLVAGVQGSPGDWNQALMELGALVCVPRDPLCDACPVRSHCRALSRGIVGELPSARQKRAPLSVRRTAIVLASSRAVLLARRRTDSLFGGLWEPPTTEGSLGDLVASLGLDALDAEVTRKLKVAGEVVHVLTHRRMHVEVARGKLPRRPQWPIPGPEYDAIEPVALEDLGARAHSTLARKVLIMANVAARGLPWKK